MAYPDGGLGNYIASIGAATHAITNGQRLLAARFFANGSDGTFFIAFRTTSTGQIASPVIVRSGFGFDWTPAARLTNCVITVSTSIDFFGEVSS